MSEKKGLTLYEGNDEQTDEQTKHIKNNTSDSRGSGKTKKKRIRITIMARLMTSFIMLIVIPMTILGVMTYSIVKKQVVLQAQAKTISDLNVARNIYTQVSRDIESAVRYAASRQELINSVRTVDKNRAQFSIMEFYKNESFDFLNVTDTAGRVIVRATNPDISGDSVTDDILVKTMMESGHVTSGTYISEKKQLEKERDLKNTDYKTLADRSYLELIPTNGAKPTDLIANEKGMVIGAGSPIRNEAGEIIGYIYGGYLINRNFGIVDKIKKTIYQGLDDAGTATIFQDDLRISTNVQTLDGKRAIGTRVSLPVYEAVLEHGEVWKSRAFVVNMWYVTAYEPIRDITGKIIGILYVGIKESEYVLVAQQARNLVFLIALICLFVMGIPASYLISRSISNRLRRITDATREISAGDLTVLIEDIGNDEITDLVSFFNVMTKNLRTLASQIYGGVALMTSSANQILSTSRQHEDRLMDQSAAISEITATVEEFSSASKQISSSASSIANMADKTLEKAKFGGQAVSETADGVKQIKENTMGSAAKILSLGEKSQDIGNVVKIINDIADNTKLIAFNAAIEAAGAGEAGKRFAVVAVEVRNLAENVVESTEEIKSIIHEIQNTTKSSVMASEEGVAKVGKGMELAAKANELLDEIVMLMEDTNQSARQISGSTQQQMTASEQLVSAIKDFYQMNKDSVVGSKQTTEAAQQLNDLAESLIELVEKFTLS